MNLLNVICYLLFVIFAHSAQEECLPCSLGAFNGDITSRQAGSIGGQMVKKMIEAYENGLK